MAGLFAREKHLPNLSRAIVNGLLCVLWYCRHRLVWDGRLVSVDTSTGVHACLGQSLETVSPADIMKDLEVSVSQVHETHSGYVEHVTSVGRTCFGKQNNAYVLRACVKKFARHGLVLRISGGS